MFKSVLVLALVCCYATASPTTGFVTPFGFEYIGNAEGKIFLKAGLSTAEQYGVTWQRAIEICSDSGYRMASITTKAQDDIVKTYVSEGSPDSKKWMWIDGTNFASKNGTWFSLNTGRNLEFFNWVPGRPVTSDNTRNCLRWSRNSFDAGWWDIGCDDTHNVLCEVDVA